LITSPSHTDHSCFVLECLLIRPHSDRRSYRTLRRASPKSPAVKKARAQVLKLRRSVRRQQRRVTKFWLRSGPKSARATVRKLAAARRQRRSLRRALRKARRAQRQARKLVGKSPKQVRAYWKRQVQKARASLRARKVLYTHTVSVSEIESITLLFVTRFCERM
jgi:hypothetical protein